MIKYNKKVMVLIQDTRGVLKDFPQFQKESLIDGTYANTPNLNEMIAYYEKIVKEFYVKDKRTNRRIKFGKCHGHLPQTQLPQKKVFHLFIQIGTKYTNFI